MKYSIYGASALLLILVALTIGVKFYGARIQPLAAGGAAPQAMPVDVVEIQRENVEVWKQFSGRVVPVTRAEIRPQVSGRITDVRFEDGQDVKRGDILVVIDPRPFRAAVNEAQAVLNVAITQAKLAETEYQRAENLIESDAIARSLLDERANRRDATSASVEGARAILQSAKINLDYAYVKAPISGKISRAEITEGNVVQHGAGAPLLTSIVANETVYTDFEVDERTYLNALQAGALTEDSKVSVRLILLDGEIEYSGTVDSFDNRINPASGTIRARAIFNNDDKILLPGMSVSILMGSTDEEKKIIVSERAIGTDQDRKFVYVVDQDNAAKYREVKIGESIDGRRIILSGLKEGEKVITAGLARIRPGMPVTPQVKSASDQEQPTPPPIEQNPAAGEEE